MKAGVESGYPGCQFSARPTEPQPFLSKNVWRSNSRSHPDFDTPDP